MIIDTHQHFWNLDLLEYSWLVPEFGPLYRSFGPQELAPQLKSAGVAKTVLVQAANSYDDTNYMLRKSSEFDWIAGVVGWVPLWNPREAAPMLDRYKKHPKFCGMRHLIHEEQNSRWLQQDLVIESLKLLAERGLSFDAVPVLPEHLANVPVIAEKVPDLKIVIDHLSKPPIKAREWGAWAELMKECAQYPNIYGKVSGLNTAADWENWSAADLKPYIDFVVEHFGADRLMFGSDWPVAILAGDYQKVKGETEKAIAHLSTAEQEAIWSKTAISFYSLKV
ncbi:MAG: amidohydrolase family protein [Trueperaceae bacterium]|nr:amidohydrolase family protein [Trueperaceae bacterium]